MRWIPLWCKDVIVDWAQVDDEDYDRVSSVSWFRQSGYAGRVGSDRKIIYMHREIMGLTFGDDLEVDHKDLTRRLDNRRENLRIGSCALNKQNLSPFGYANSSTGHRGITWNNDRQRWRAKVNVGGRQVYNRYFVDKEEAIKEIKRVRKEYMPFTMD